jgi:hypothetical protein
MRRRPPLLPDCRIHMGAATVCSVVRERPTWLLDRDRTCRVIRGQRAIRELRARPDPGSSGLESRVLSE